MALKPISILTILLVILVGGCIPQKEITEKSVEKTALLSSTEFFCVWTEQSKPFAYFQFAYQENGEIKYVKTKTSCKDFKNKNFTMHVFGEQIKLFYNRNNPVAIERENGDYYQIEPTTQTIRSYFIANINPYENPNSIPQNYHADLIIEECKLLKNPHEHDTCIAYQAAFQQEASICDKLVDTSNKNLCKQWVQNIKEGKINE